MLLRPSITRRANLRFRFPGRRYAAHGITAALFAPLCAVCDTVLDEPLSGCVCGKCWDTVRPSTPPVCDACGDPLARPAHQCIQCSGHERVIDRARAVGEYQGTLREIIHALKYSGRRSLSRPLAERMQLRGIELLRDADCVVPVPLHWRREYQRGFNQARELACHLGLPMSEALVRRRQTRAQVELAADRRHSNVKHAFALRTRWFRRSPVIEGQRVVLVDDVSTTGATLEACAVVLKQGGASAVYALTAARVVSRRRHDNSTNP
jgi:ComF family protein